MSRYSEILDRYREEGRYRILPSDRSKAKVHDLCSNDYMGLAKRDTAELMTIFHRRWPDVPMTSSASRLLSTHQKIFCDFEEYLEEAYGKPALLFNSGYHANVGLVSALNLPGTLWLTDKLIHASVVDGLKMAGADFKRWRHNDIAQLRKIIEKEKDSYERLIVVCESIYSMDGDAAPLKELAGLKKEYPNLMLYVDEAHAIGSFGPQGHGLCAETGIIGDVDILVGTFGKACASVGAFAVTGKLLKDYLVNNARSLIFSTAIAPANVAWSHLMFEQLAKMDNERAHLARISVKFRRGIEKITGLPNPSASAIVPLITGDSARAVEISRRLERDGILALPIRRPTVPPGSERIRFSLHAGLTETDIDNVLEKIAQAYDETK